MSEHKFTFEDIPRVMAQVIEKLNELNYKLDGMCMPTQPPEEKLWMSLKELQEYLPSHPADQTVYGWTSNHSIPFHKRGKRIMFLKSEIDEWLHNGKVKSQAELEKEAFQYIQSKRKHSF